MGASRARHQGRRGVGHPDQGYHCRRWCHPPHPQVPHRQEGGGWPTPSPLTAVQYFNSIVPSYRITSFFVENCRSTPPSVQISSARFLARQLFHMLQLII